MNPSTYRPEMDGLRAVAVLAVLCFHAGFGMSGGFVGVDVFFVISGFLITGLIDKDLQAGQFSFLDFWERRIRRIFPALTVMVAITLAVGACCLMPEEFKSLGKSALSQTALVANFHFQKKADYFEGSAELKPLLHTWSLAVEEQFYLLLPVLLVFCRQLSRSRLISLLSVLAIVSFCGSVWGTYFAPSKTFYLLPGRAWELLLGSVLALACPLLALSLRFRSAISWAGLAGILFACIWYDRETRFPGANAVIPCLGTALIIFANSSGLTGVGKLLATRPMVMIGRLSYSLYLWHWPVLALMRTMSPTAPSASARFLAMALSFGLAWLSWKFVETPFRRAQHLSQRRVYGLAISCSLLVIGISWSVVFTEGFPNRLAQNTLQALKCGEVTEYPKAVITSIGAELPSEQLGTFLLWGDSHSLAISRTIDNLAKKSGTSGYLWWSPGVIPVPGVQDFFCENSTIQQNEKTMEFIKSHRIPHVILAARWNLYIELSKYGNRHLLAERQTDDPTPESARRLFRQGLGKMLDELKSQGVTVWLMKQVPEQEIPEPRFAAIRSSQYGWKAPRGISIERYRSQQAALDRILDELCKGREEYVHILDPLSFCFEDTGFSKICHQSYSYYFDGDHLSWYGAQELLSPMFQPILRQIPHTSKIAGPVSASDEKPMIQQAVHQSTETIIR